MSFWKDIGGALISGLASSSPLGAIASIGSSLIGGIAGNKSVKSQNQANLQIAEANNQTQRDIAQQNNQTQIDMMRENNQFSRDMAIEMFNMENQYNSPVEQVKRLQEAGINPAVYFGSGSGTSAGISDASTPSAAGSTISPNMPAMVNPHMEAAPPVISGVMDSLSQLVNMSLAMQQAKKAGAETKTLEALLDPTVKKMIKDIENIEVQTNHQRFMNEMDYLYESNERNYRLKNLIKDLALKGTQITTLASQGKLAEAQSLLADVERAFTNSRNTELKTRMPYIVPTLQAQIDVYKAQEEEARAGAQEKRAQAGVLRQEERRLVDTYQSFIDEFDAKSGKEVLSFARELATQKAQIASIINQSEKTETEKETAIQQLDQAYQLAELARKENSTFYARQFIQSLGTLLGGAGVLVGVTKVFGSSKPTKVSGFGN